MKIKCSEKKDQDQFLQKKMRFKKTKHWARNIVNHQNNTLYAPLQSRKDQSVSFRRTPARAFTPLSLATITTRSRKAAKYFIIVVAKGTKIISYRERIARQNAKRCHVRKARSLDNNAHAHDAFKNIFFFKFQSRSSKVCKHKHGESLHRS